MIRTRAALAMAALVAAMLAGCSGERPSPDRPPRPVGVATVATVAGGDALRYAADVVPREQVPVAFKLGGHLAAIARRPATGGERPIQPGDRVTRGEVLARIRPDEYRDRVDQVRAQHAEAEAALVRARAERERAERLFATASLVRPELDAAIAGFDMASARVEGARAQLSGAELALADCVVRAPLDSVVIGRHVEPGQLVSPGTVGFVLADIAEVRVAFGVPDRIAERLSIGQTLAVTSAALGDRAVDGTVIAIAPSADPRSRLFAVELSLANPDGRLKPGLIASVELGDTVAAGPQPVVPLSAIVRPHRAGATGGYAVFVVGAGVTPIVEERAVELGEFAGNGVVVNSGVAVGERVVVTGTTLVVDGEQVRVLP